MKNSSITGLTIGAETQFQPSLVYRLSKMSGISATSELLCRSKPLFFAEAIVAISASAFWGWRLGSSELAFCFSAVCCFLILIALACSCAVALPQPGTPLILTPDFSHRQAQCQLHMNTRSIRMAEGVKSIANGLGCVEDIGLRRVLLRSVLIGSDAMREGIVKRLNLELGKQGRKWVAVDEGKETWRYGDLVYKVAYHFVPWLTLRGTHKKSPQLESREGGGYAWGLVYLERL